MPRYFFHAHHLTEQRDENGEELPDSHAAWKEATVMAGKVLQDVDGTSRTRFPCRFSAWSSQLGGRVEH
ncbi:DUF6894 family protein [Bradyrhizobium sp. USDA 3364]